MPMNIAKDTKREDPVPIQCNEISMTTRSEVENGLAVRRVEADSFQSEADPSASTSENSVANAAGDNGGSSTDSDSDSDAESQISGGYEIEIEIEFSKQKNGAANGGATRYEIEIEFSKKANPSSRAVNPVSSYECHICTKKFKRRSSLSSHVLRMHTGQRPFVCPTSSCGRRFVDRQSLRSHQRANGHGKRPQYYCSLCGKPTRAYLKRLVFESCRKYWNN